LGILAPTEISAENTRRATLPVLVAQGFVEGRNLVVDFRIGNAERLPELARAMVAAKPDAIYAISNNAVEAAANATADVPIVMFGADPVIQGYVKSLAKPGGRMTGVTVLSSDLDGKRLELLREAMPRARRIAAILPPSSSRDASLAALRKVAAVAGVELVPFDAPTPGDYAAAFAGMRKADAQALVIGAHAQLYRDTRQLVALARESKLPTICEWPDMARAGCVIGYGPDADELRRRAGEIIARIFKGAKPGDQPIEGPTRFELAINLKEARALGLDIPQSLLLRADEVIE
jgi:putative ABC transport system substrate-binding protein